MVRINCFDNALGQQVVAISLPVNDHTFTTEQMSQEPTSRLVPILVNTVEPYCYPFHHDPP